MNNEIEEDCTGILNTYRSVPFTGKRVLITGSTGQIGSYFIVFFYLMKRIYPDLIIDAYYSTEIPLHLLKYKSGINFIKVDLGELITNKVDYFYDFIIYGAGYGQPVKFTQNKSSTFVINSLGLINQIGNLRNGGKFIYLSTSEVYANNDYDFQSESDDINVNPNNLRNSYIISKLFGEEVTKTSQTKNLDFKIARVCLAYGPGTKANDSRVLNELIHQAITKKVIHLLDSGLASRTYCYILDTLTMLLNILFYGTSTVYNVGNPESVTILEVAKMIGQNCEVSEVVTPIKETSNQLDIRTQSPIKVSIDINKYVNEFGPVKFKPLKEGIMRTIEWQKHHLFMGERL
jgi:UDP-glucuronate decarboxylase